MTVTYHVGDTRKVIATIPDGSVDLIASSPPFLALRSYVPEGHESKGDEIGSEANPAEFIDMLLGLTAEWGRVLAAHGSIAIELGDTYSGSGGAGGDYNEGGWRDGQGKVDGSASRITKNAPRYSAATGHIADARGGTAEVQMRNNGGAYWPRAKSLALIPQLYAVALAYGINPLTGAPSPAGRWLVRNVIVWHRPNPAVGALGDKVRPSTSYIVVATRSPKRWFDLTAVRTTYKPDMQALIDKRVRTRSMADQNVGIGSDWTNRDGFVGKDAGGAPPLDAWFDPYDSDLAEAMSYDGSHDTWTLTTQPSRLAHYAMWPAKLAERLILMMCPLAVCRVCGEPRRRIEGAAEYVTANGSRHNGHEWGSGIVDLLGAHSHKPDGNTTRTAPTVGWTDCNGRHAPSSPPYYRPGLVLDPFAGSGTTLAVADLHGRDAIGIDFDQRNHDLYPARYDEVKKALYGTPAPMPGQETFDFAI